MEISTNGNSVTIDGNIKSVSDYQSIKSTLDPLVRNDTIIINIVNSISITSSVIGYFNKLVLKDKINIQMNIGNEQLMELLQDLNLASIFNAKKI
ncbi:MAG: hypothetical protein U9N02_02770 [Campylobacterota bacterium]|nr:hypothetical protein [Campylobacterota bacterium]